MTLIAEDLLLLLLDDESGNPSADSTKLPRVLAGALVVELALGGSLRITGPGEQTKKDHVVVAGDPPADPLLRRGFDLVATASRPMKPPAAAQPRRTGAPYATDQSHARRWRQ